MCSSKLIPITMNLRSIVALAVLAGTISCNSAKFHTSTIEGNRLAINNEIAADTSIENYIKPYANHIEKVLDSALAYNPTNLVKNDGALNTPIGNMMADLVMEQANPIFKSRTGNTIDMVLLNFGGIRSSIAKGNITTRTAYSAMPFENEIVIAELSPERMKELLQYLEVAKTAHPVSGVQIRVDKDFKVIDAKIQDKPLDAQKNYFVATSDYLQQGGDNMNFFKDPVHLYRTDYKIRNAIIDYFIKVDTIKTVKDNRYIQIK